MIDEQGMIGDTMSKTHSTNKNQQIVDTEHEDPTLVHRAIY